MDDCVFDFTALDVCRVVKVTSDTVVVDCVVVDCVALEVCTGVVMEVAGCAVEVKLPSN